MGKPKKTIHVPDTETFEHEQKLTFVEKVYWAYYIHLPFYLMTTGEAFILHSIMFLFFSLIVYGIGVYSPSYMVSWSARVYYYLTGDNLLQSFKTHLPHLSEKYLKYADMNWFNITELLDNVVS